MQDCVIKQAENVLRTKKKKNCDIDKVVNAGFDLSMEICQRQGLFNKNYKFSFKLLVK